MELSAEEFSRIVHSLGGTPVTSLEAEYRRAARIDRQVQLTITPITDGAPDTPFDVQVKNISSRGMGFIRDRRMKIASQFIVRMSREEMRPVEILCTVVHCAQLSNEIWSVGAEFTCVSPITGGADAAEAARIRNSILG